MEISNCSSTLYLLALDTISLREFRANARVIRLLFVQITTLFRLMAHAPEKVFAHWHLPVGCVVR